MSEDKPPKSTSPQFVDLFYAVVVGGSLGLIGNVDDYVLVAARLFMIVVVLEDWFAYFKFVVPNIVQKQRYTPYSLIMEFGILVSWYLSVVSLSSNADRHYHLFLFIPIFFLIRFLAGFRAHFRRGTVRTKEFFSEFLYAIHALIYFRLFLMCYWGELPFWSAFGWFVLAYLILTIIWWTIRYSEFKERS
jgi:hypothetical protein